MAKEKSLNEMTKVELLELCETLGIEISKHSVKADIVARIEEAEKKMSFV